MLRCYNSSGLIFRFLVGNPEKPAKHREKRPDPDRIFLTIPAYRGPLSGPVFDQRFWCKVDFDDADRTRIRLTIADGTG